MWVLSAFAAFVSRSETNGVSTLNVNPGVKTKRRFGANFRIIGLKDFGVSKLSGLSSIEFHLHSFSGFLEALG